MRSIKNTIIVVWCLVNCAYALADYGTFFRPRSVTFDQTFELALANYHMYHTGSDDYHWGSLYVSPFYQQSTHKNKLARFFLPNHKSCIALREDGLGDVGSLWLGLISAPGTSFSSTICLEPERKCYGAYVNLHANFDCYVRGLWASISFAAMQVRHTIGLRECNLTNPGTLDTLQTGIEALNNPAWCFGKFSCRTLRKSGVDDIQIKVGYDWFFCDENHAGAYLVGGIPTGKKPNAHYVFEPLVGTNHGSFGFGLNGDYDVWQCDNHEITLMGDFKYRYIFKARERRSFDLCANGAWSRYLLVAQQSSPAVSQPGINVLTQPVTVTPRSTAELWLAAHYTHGDYGLEVGYNFWWRQREKLCVQCPFPPNIGIYDMSGTCDGDPTSASQANISQSIMPPNQAPHDPTFIAITVQDLNFRSAEHPQAISNKLYAAFSYSPIICSIPCLFGLTGSYEIGHENSALSQWAIWISLGICF